ncbi:RraA family protein [Paenibacillus koleovorans]|uniref:RraA family protein n=1 Tax=Paenibacillus koleovorans TaxID=121608 RepID=UPI000FD9D5AF|nr:RraA family protein [Paenibacillus koleovorans]
MIHVGPDFKRVDPDLIAGYRKTNPATVGHVREDGFADTAIRPVYRKLKLVGSAFTVQIAGRDLAAISKAYELAQPGDVLVVNGGDGPAYACAGEISTFTSMRMGLAGLIVDGAVTDVIEMEAIGFPCFARHISAKIGRKEGNSGAVRVPVEIGGVIVYPGDLVVADDNGIVFLNPEEAHELLPTLLEKEAAEVILRSDYWNSAVQAGS